MFSNDVMVLDIGSHSVRCLIGNRNLKNIFNIKGFSEYTYSGFGEGAFYDTDDLKNAVLKAVTDIKTRVKNHCSTIYVGVPGEFSQVICTEVTRSYEASHIVNIKDITDMNEEGAKLETADELPINAAPVYYVLDGNTRLINPLDISCKTIKALISFTLMDKAFKKVLDEALAPFNFKKIEYTSSSLAEAMHLFEPELRDKYVLLADIGYMSTTLMLIRGDGIVHQLSFSMGGAHIAGDFLEAFDIPFEVAEKLKDMLNLNYDSSEMPTYRVHEKEESYEFDLDEVNTIAKARIAYLGECINDCLIHSAFECPRYVGLYITGGGINYIKGAKEFLSSFVNRTVETVETNLPGYDKAHITSSIALLDSMINLDESGQNPIKKLINGLFN